eukprot:1138976-Pelagomonas_calceolata.AAC.4
MASNVYGITNVLPPLAPPAAALPAACRFCLPASALNKPFNSFLDARLARRNCKHMPGVKQTKPGKNDRRVAWADPMYNH